MINPLPPTVSVKTRRPTLKSMGRGWGMVIKKPPLIVSQGGLIFLAILC